MPNACKRPLVLRTTSKFSARARLLVRLHDRNHRMEAKIHIDRSGPPGGGTPCPAAAVPAPHSPLTPSCLLQGPPQDKRVRAERALAAASMAVPPHGGSRPPHPRPLSAPQVPQVQHPDVEQQNPAGRGQSPGRAGLRLPVPGRGPHPDPRVLCGVWERGRDPSPGSRMTLSLSRPADAEGAEGQQVGQGRQRRRRGGCGAGWGLRGLGAAGAPRCPTVPPLRRVPWL